MTTNAERLSFDGCEAGPPKGWIPHEGVVTFPCGLAFSQRFADEEISPSELAVMKEAHMEHHLKGHEPRPVWWAMTVFSRDGLIVDAWCDCEGDPRPERHR